MRFKDFPIFPFLMVGLAVIGTMAAGGCEKIKSPATAQFELMSCDRNGCAKLAAFAEYIDCEILRSRITTLHKKVLKEKPAKVLMCYDTFNKKLEDM